MANGGEIKLRGPYATDCGMVALWDPASFQNVTDFDTWEPELVEDEDIERHIKVGAFVPLYIHSDGCFEVEVRVGGPGAFAVLSDRERQYLGPTSQAYLFRSQGALC